MHEVLAAQKKLGKEKMGQLQKKDVADPCGIETGFKKLATASTKGVNAPGPFAAGLGGKVSQPLPGR